MWRLNRVASDIWCLSKYLESAWCCPSKICWNEEGRNPAHGGIFGFNTFAFQNFNSQFFSGKGLESSRPWISLNEYWACLHFDRIFPEYSPLSFSNKVGFLRKGWKSAKQGWKLKMCSWNWSSRGKPTFARLVFYPNIEPPIISSSAMKLWLGRYFKGCVFHKLNVSQNLAMCGTIQTERMDPI